MSTRHDLVAERALLAMAMSGHPSARERFLALPVGLWHPSTEPVATVLRDRLVRDVPLDPITLAGMVAERVGTDEQAQRLRRFVHECAETCPPLDTWPYYEQQVVLCLAIREADRNAQTLAQRLDTATEAQHVADAVHAVLENLQAVTTHLGPRAAEPPLSLRELLDMPEEEHDWLVPGLWERTDRLILTGYEGTGKSMLLAQFATTTAGGVHPFHGTVIDRDGHRVLVIDCENSMRQIRRRYAQLVGTINHIRETHAMTPVDWKQQVRFVVRPDGIDLANVEEFARIEQAIAATAPDLVIAGPLYRMHRTNINDEEAARQLVDALDRLRVKYRFTLICEAHVGHVGEQQGGRKLRPTGSSLFLRWPEFGFGIRGATGTEGQEHPNYVDLVAWRGARDERAWPEQLKHGGHNWLPWVPTETR